MNPNPNHMERDGTKSFHPSFSTWSQSFFLLITVLVVAWVFIVPMLRLVGLSFTTELGFSFEHYIAVFSEKKTFDILVHTAWAVLGSTGLALVIGVSIAWMMAYTDIRAKHWLHLLILLPFIIPSYIITLSWTQFMGTNSWIADGLSSLPFDIPPPNLYSLGGIILLMGISHYPLVYLFAVHAFRQIPRDAEWAARVGGAGQWSIFKRITVPMALPGIAGGSLLAFLAGLDNFGIPAFLGIPANIQVLSTSIYQEVTGFGPDAFARASTLSVLLTVIALGGTLVQWRILRRAKPLETTRPDFRPRITLKRYRLWIEGFIWGGLVFISLIPLTSMLFTSVTRAYGLDLSWETFTLDHYRYVLFENSKAKRALENSFFLSTLTMLICLIVGTVFAWFRVRKPGFGSRLIEWSVAIPYALPGMVLALAMILAWMEPIPGWNPGIYGTVTLLLIAYITRFLFLQMRGSITAFLQVDPSMEEAGRLFGASRLTRWRRIIMPLIWPGMMSGALLVFLTAFTELTVSSLLWSSGAETIGLVIFNFEQAGYTTYSTAFSTWVVCMIGIGLVVGIQLRRFQHRKEETQ